MCILNLKDEKKQEYYYLFLRSELNNEEILVTNINTNERIEAALTVLEGYYNLNNSVVIPNFLRNSRYLTEFYLENFRKKSFFHLPTRLACIFAVANIETANLIRENYRWKTPLVKIKLMEDSKIAKCDMLWLEYLDRIMSSETSIDVIEKACNYYWQGIALNAVQGITAPPPHYEYLIAGEALIIK